MEDEIDLRQYIEVLIRRWRWIFGFAVVAVVAAAAISYLVLEPVYEAQAMVLITNPRYQLRFDPRLETLSDIETNSKVYPSLALSDDLLRQVLEVLDPPLPAGESSLPALRSIVAASAGADPSLLELKVTNGAPERAAQIANAWAKEYVTYVNELYGQRSEDVVFFTEQLETARGALEAAEQALIAFESGNQQSILEARLEAKRRALADYLSAQNELALVIQDAQALRQRLEGQPASAPASLGDDLATLLLEIQGLSQDARLPLQLQVPAGSSLSNKTVGEQIDLLDDLIAALESQRAAMERQIAAVSAEILPLQEAYQEATTERERLSREQEVAQDTYTTLANKVAETRIAAQDETGEVRLASRASVPIQPSGPRRLMNVVVAGFLGLLGGVFVAFFIEFWQTPTETRSG